MAGNTRDFPIHPRHFASQRVVPASEIFKATVFDMIIPGANAIVLTQYYGFWKLLLMAVTPKLAEYYTHGYIKLRSIKTLVQMLREVGSFDIRFERVGHIPILAKSMIAIERTT